MVAIHSPGANFPSWGHLATSGDSLEALQLSSLTSWRFIGVGGARMPLKALPCTGDPPNTPSRVKNYPGQSVSCVEVKKGCLRDDTAKKIEDVDHVGNTDGGIPRDVPGGILCFCFASA